MTRPPLHETGAYLALAGVVAGVVLAWFIAPRVAAVTAVSVVVIGGALFFGSGR